MAFWWNTQDIRRHLSEKICVALLFIYFTFECLEGEVGENVRTFYTIGDVVIGCDCDVGTGQSLYREAI